MVSRALRARIGQYSKNFDALIALRSVGYLIAGTLNTEDRAQKEFLVYFMILHEGTRKPPKSSLEAFTWAANWYMLLKQWRERYHQVLLGGKVDRLLKQYQWLEIKVENVESD